MFDITVLPCAVRCGSLMLPTPTLATHRPTTSPTVTAPTRTPSRLTALTSSPFTDTKVSDAGVSSLTRLVHLERLDLGHSDVEDMACDHLSHLTSLTALGLDCANVTDAGVKRLATLKGLRVRVGCGVGVGGGEGEGVGAGAGVRGGCEGGVRVLHGVTLTCVECGCNTSKAPPFSLPQELDLFSAKLHDESVRILARMSGLTRLEVCGGKLSDGSAVHLAQMRNMRALSLAQNGK